MTSDPIPPGAADCPPEQVLVIGAGAAGLACAATLTAAGRPVLVLEAAARIGGRIRSDRGASGAVWEMGAQVVHDRANPVWQHFPAGQLDPFSDSDFRVVLANRRVPMFALATLDLAPWSLLPELASVSGSPAAALAGRSTRTARICGQWLAHDWAADPAVMDLTEMREIADAPGAVGDEAVVRGGFGRLVDTLATGVPIRRSTPVHRLRAVPGGVVAVTAQGPVRGSAAVVTVPPWTVGGSGLHIDDLPDEKAAAAAGLRGGDAVVALLATSAVAPGTASVFDADTGLGFLRSQRGAGEVQIVAKGPGAQALRDALRSAGPRGRQGGQAGPPPKALQAVLSTAFPWLAGTEFGSVAVADWGRCPAIGGAFTSPTAGRARHSAAWAAPMAGGIFFAGESCCAARGVGRVHGALATGRRAALQVLASGPRTDRPAPSLLPA